MLWGATGMRREVKKKVKTAVQKSELGFYPPPIIELRQRRVTGGRIGLGEAVVRI